ncbi:MAG: adenylate/guanylate cyclase domain-containing protein [Rhizobiales bacterium]|nr:adenylate/guanylate cyclase domain-containing protein [Hyphomicrobiales bacterium]
MLDTLLLRGRSGLFFIFSQPELRAIILRIVAIAGALAILFIGDSQHGSAVYFGIAAAYFTGVVVLAIAMRRQSARRLIAAFIMMDALLVACVLYQDLLGTTVTDNHSLTTAGLVVPFIVLSHVAMNLNGRLIFAFAAAVLLAWLAMLAVMALRHELSVKAFFGLDLGLALGFAFAAGATGLLALDHKRTRRQVQEIDRWRNNLARFFSPAVVSDLQEAGQALNLKRRSAAIMFVDLRDFTSYAEQAPAGQLAGVLAEYRRLVAGTVFAHGGTIDKFIGDGVMAVFGHPTAAADDASRALACAIELTELLCGWHPSESQDAPIFETGIGLHYGSVIGGVLESGYHDEFTVIGDAVNVAQRLETLTKELDAALVVSCVVLALTRRGHEEGWIERRGMLLAGRRLPIDIAYLPRPRQSGARAARHAGMS